MSNEQFDQYSTLLKIEGNSIQGRVIAEVDQYNIGRYEHDKVITPYYLHEIMKSAGGGGTYPTDATFDQLTVNSINIIDTTIDAKNGGTGINYYDDGDLLVGNSSHELDILPKGSDDTYLAIKDSLLQWLPLSATLTHKFADDEEIVQPVTVDNKLMSPLLTNNLLLQPPEIGSIEPNNSKFININFEKVNGLVIADLTEVYDATINDQIITPKGLNKLFTDPPIIGLTTQEDGYFKDLSCSSLTLNGVYLTEIPYSTNSESLNQIISEKSIVPSNIPYIFDRPYPIGEVTPNNGNFSILTTDDLNITGLITADNPPWIPAANMFANNSEVTGKTITNKALNPSHIDLIFSTPSVIGSATANDGYFNNLTTEALTVTGTPPWPTLDIVFCDDFESIDTLISNKGIVPSNLPNIFANPNPIGSTTPNTGEFSTLTAKSITLTETSLDPTMGGTGQYIYDKGDIIVASSSTILGKLPIGLDGQTLEADSTQTLGLRWVNGSGSTYPSNYHAMSSPKYLNGNSYYIQYGNFRNYTNTDDIIINADKTINITTENVADNVISGYIISNYLSNTVTLTNTTTIETDDSINVDFTGIFTVGDIITIDTLGGRRIIDVTSTTLVVEPAFGSTGSNLGYRRGGQAPDTVYYLYALGSNSNPTYLMSPRCGAIGDYIIDIPGDYSLSNIVQTRYDFLTDSNGLFYRKNYNENYASFYPYIPLGTINYNSGNATTIDLTKYISRTSDIITIKVTLTTTNVSGSNANITLLGDSNNNYICETPIIGTISETVTVNLQLNSFKIGISDNNATANIVLLGYYLNNKNMF